MTGLRNFNLKGKIGSQQTPQFSSSDSTQQQLNLTTLRCNWKSHNHKTFCITNTLVHGRDAQYASQAQDGDQKFSELPCFPPLLGSSKNPRKEVCQWIAASLSQCPAELQSSNPLAAKSTCFRSSRILHPLLWQTCLWYSKTNEVMITES